MPRLDNNDFNQEQYTQKVDALVAFKQEFEGKNFDDKICKAIHDSVPLQKEIKSLIGSAVKDKILWVIGAVALFLFSNFLSALIPKLVDRLAK